ncbi:MAG: sulfite exporter TauE/SafE family protein [Syntrophomonadaceae bacterium]|jgi:uncharacterized membrane protein YfcA|nr:sulfite exporter TauE/SafE family protein [Syntrophomonadaceae bacterium]
MLTHTMALLTGALAGMVGALLGVSGGIIMLPANQFILGFSPPLAVGTSLFAAIFTTISGGYGHFRQGNVQVKTALLIGSAGLVGTLLGSYIFKAYLSANAQLLEFLLGLLFLSMTVRMSREAYKEWRGQPNNKPGSARVNSEIVHLLLLGLVTGTMAGIFGVGGGFLIVPALIWFLAFEPYMAVGTTLLAMLPYITLGSMIKLQQGFVNLPAGLLLGVGAILGAQLGVIISRKVSPLTFKIIFTLLFFYLSCRYLYPF